MEAVNPERRDISRLGSLSESREETWLARRRASLLVIMGYLALAVAYAWPLPMHLADKAVLARGADFYQHIWNLWWVKFSLLALHRDPYFTDYLHHPGGQSLVYHSVDALNGVASIPIQGLFGLLAAFNLLRLGHLVLAASATYALCRTLRLPRPAAWVGGALFMICPTAATSFDLGQLDVISTGWIPLYILCLIRGLGNRALRLPPGRWGWLAGAALSLWAATLSTWYFFTALALFTALYVAWEVVATWLADEERTTPQSAEDLNWPEAKNRQAVAHTQRLSSIIYRLVGRAVAIGAGALILLSPLIAALIRENVKGGDHLVSPLKTVIANSADLLAPFLPMPARYSNTAINPHGGSPALGWTVIALALAGLTLYGRARGRKGEGERNEPVRHRHLFFWAVVATVFTLLALGPHLLVAGNDTGVPMPYLLLGKMPFLGAARVPMRFMLIVSLAASVLAAYGLVALWKTVRSTGLRAITYTLIGALLALELIGVPRTLIAPTVHPFFNTIATKSAEGKGEAVMELPGGLRAAPAMLGQTIHQHPILEAYTSRKYPYPWFDTTPGIAQLGRSDADAFLEPDIVKPPISKTALVALDYYGVRYVAVHTTGNAGQDQRARDAADALFGPRNISPLIQDASLTVYKIPPQSHSSPLVGLGRGWYGVESAGVRRWRWTDGHAWVQITNPTGRAMSVQVNLAAYTVAQTRTILVSLDGQELARKAVGPYPSQQMTFEIELSAGEHWLEISSLQPAEAPPGDTRRLSIGFEEVRVERR